VNTDQHPHDPAPLAPAGVGRPDDPLQRLQRLGRYLAVDPNNTALLRDYAGQAWQAQELEACVQAGARLVTHHHAEPGDHLLLAQALRQQHECQPAIELLESAVRRWPQEEPLWIELAHCRFAAGELDAALDALPHACTDSRWAGHACSLRVRLLHHLGRLDEAVEVAQQFEPQYGASAEVQASLLAVLVDQSRLEQAVRLAQALLPASGDVAAAPYEVAEPLAMQALDEGRTERALHWADWALARRADDGRIWLLKGLAHLQANQRDAAIQALERAAFRMPAHAGSHLGLGWACLLQGDRVRARQAFEAGAQASPAFAEAYGSLAVVEAAEGRVQMARAHVRKAQLLDRQCASALFALALLEGRSGTDITRMAEAVIARARGARQPAPRSH
jgi:tetratricopeptide (TPR) repeat protein